METMDGKGSKTMPLRNKNAPKVPNSSTSRVSNHLVRMRSPVQIWVAAPEKEVKKDFWSKNQEISRLRRPLDNENPRASKFRFFPTSYSLR